MWLHLAVACGRSPLGTPGTAGSHDSSDGVDTAADGTVDTAADGTADTDPADGTADTDTDADTSETGVPGHTGDTGIADTGIGATAAGHPPPQWFCSEPGASMTFTPADPAVGGAVDVSVTAPVGYVYVGMTPSPPSGWTELGYAVSGSGPFTWTWTYALDRADRFDFAFSADSGALAVCAGSVWTVAP